MDAVPNPTKCTVARTFIPARHEPGHMARDDTLLNALIGAVVSVVLAFLPFSPVLGGAVAGYLQRGPRSEGLRIGAYAGAIAAIPIILGFALFGSVFFIGALFEPTAAFGFVVLLFVLAMGLVYTVGLSALGGYLGSYVAEEYRE